MLKRKTLFPSIAVFLLVLFSACTKPNAPTSQNFQAAIANFMTANPDKFSVYSRAFPSFVSPEFQKISCGDSLPHRKQIFFLPCNFSSNEFYQLQKLGFYTKDPSSKYFILSEKKASDHCVPHILHGLSVAFGAYFAGDCSVRTRVVGYYVFDRISQIATQVDSSGNNTATVTALFREDANNQLANILQIDPYYLKSSLKTIHLIQTNNAWIVDGRNFK